MLGHKFTIRKLMKNLRLLDKCTGHERTFKGEAEVYCRLRG